MPEPEEAVIYYDRPQKREHNGTRERQKPLPHNLPVEKDTEFEIDMDGRATEKRDLREKRKARRGKHSRADEWEVKPDENFEVEIYEGRAKDKWEKENGTYDSYEIETDAYTDNQWDGYDEPDGYEEDEEYAENDDYGYEDDSADEEGDQDNTDGEENNSGRAGGEDIGTAVGIKGVRKGKGKRKWRIFGGDHVLWIIIIALLIVSIFVTFSAQVYKVSDPVKTLIEQLVFIGIGIAALWLVHIIKYQFYRRVAKLVWWAGIILTFAAWLYGKSIGADSTRDIALFGISFQPLEILKTGMVMLLAMQLAGRQKNIDRMKILPSLRPAEWKRNAQENIDILTKQTIPLLGPIVLTCILSFLAVGNSTTLIIGATCFVMLFIGRVRSQDLWKIIGIGVLGGVILLLSGLGRSDTGQSRLAKFTPDMYHKHSRIIQVADLDGGRDSLEIYSPPVKDYDAKGNPITESEQAVTAKMAIASGEILGKGPGMSTLRSKLPEAEKDYAYAFLVEEYGTIGGLLIMLLYLWLFFRTIQIFKRCGTAFPSLLILGLGVMITVQAIMHMMVTVGLFPVAGQQLPLISKGGSSLVFTLFSLGLILGVSRQTADNTLDRPKGESLT